MTRGHICVIELSKNRSFNAWPPCASDEISRFSLLIRNVFPDRSLCWVLQRIKRLNLEFTFPVRIGRVVPELPSKALRARNFTDTAMLIPFTSDLHRLTLHGADDLSVSTVVLYGVCEFDYVPQIAVNK